MPKPLFDRALNIGNGCLFSRMEVLESRLGRKPDDQETLSELKYLIETIPHAGLEDDGKRMVRAAKHLVNKAKFDELYG